jgi:hypothetical protein
LSRFGRGLRIRKATAHPDQKGGAIEPSDAKHPNTIAHLPSRTCFDSRRSKVPCPPPTFFQRALAQQTFPQKYFQKLQNFRHSAKCSFLVTIATHSTTL